MEKLGELVAIRSQLSVFIKGNSTTKFKHYKGLRREDSMYSFLFIFVAEILTKLLKKYEDLSMIAGFQVGND